MSTGIGCDGRGIFNTQNGSEKRLQGRDDYEVTAIDGRILLKRTQRKAEDRCVPADGPVEIFCKHCDEYCFHKCYVLIS